MVVLRHRLVLFLLLLSAAVGAGAQTIDDALMMGRRQLCTGFAYNHDSWDRYWEGRCQTGQRQRRHAHDA